MKTMYGHPRSIVHSSISDVDISYVASCFAVVLIVVEAYFCQSFFSNSILRYGGVALSAVLLLLFNTKSSRFDWKSVLWIAFVSLGAISSMMTGDYPIMLLAVVVCSALLTGNIGWVKVFLYSVIACGVFHALATITFWVSPDLLSDVVAPIFFSDSSYHVNYKSGFTAHYSTNGIYLAMSFIVAEISALFWRGGKRAKYLLSILAAVLLFALILTTKRAQLAFALAAVVGAYWLREKKAGRQLTSVFKVILVVVGLGSLLILISSFVPDVALTLDRFGEVLTDDTMNGRSDLYTVALELWSMSPVFGSGWGSFSEYFNKTPAAAVYIAAGFEKTYAHNVYLQILCELGVFGLVVFLFAVLSSLRAALKLFLNRKLESDFEVIVAASIAIQLFFIMYCFTGNPLYDFQCNSLYFLSFAAVSAIAVACSPSKVAYGEN